LAKNLCGNADGCTLRFRNGGQIRLDQPGTIVDGPIERLYLFNFKRKMSQITFADFDIPGFYRFFEAGSFSVDI
jgi:hypothetical protein